MPPLFCLGFAQASVGGSPGCAVLQGAIRRLLGGRERPLRLPIGASPRSKQPRSRARGRGGSARCLSHVVRAPGGNPVRQAAPPPRGHYGLAACGARECAALT